MVRLYVLTLLYINGTQHLLLGGRHTTGFGDGLYSLVGGKVESQERALAAIAREVYEEIGLIIEEQEFELIHTLHRQGTENEIIILTFKTDITHKEVPINKEPHKHNDIRFFDINNLPDNIISAHKQILENIKHHIHYSEHGWLSEKQ